MVTKTKTISLTLTQDCNLHCVYCYEHYKSNRVMALEDAKRIVDFELEDAADYDNIEFDLFGGEPFLAFELITQIVNYICTKKESEKCTIFLTTNGTLVHGTIQTWLIAHSCCVVCGLSLDGTREMHNTNRSNSYDDIDLEFFLAQYPQQDVKMTVSKESLTHLAEGVIDMHLKGFLVSCNLAYEIDWSASENVDTLHRELHKLINFYLENPSIEPCSMLEMGIHNIALDNDLTLRFCGAGKYMRAYDIDGKAYPCQFFMPLSIGSERAASVKDIEFPGNYLPQELLDEKCRNCIIRSVCPNCFGANFASTGNIYRRDDNLCRLIKVIVKARSYFKAKQWELGQLHESEHDQQALLRAIVMIQEKLNI